MQRLFLISVVVFPVICLSTATAMNAPDAASYNHRGDDWYAKGDYDKAMADYEAALRLDAKLAEAYNGRANVWKEKGDSDKAMGDYNEALRLNAKLADAYYGRGNVWFDKGDYDKAMIEYDGALVVNPKLAYAYNNRGQAWKEKGNYAKALADYKEALRLDPKLAFAYNNLAWLEATCPDPRYRDGKDAFLNASKAYELDDGKNWGYVDTLAAAYAENGDFEKACQWEEKAIALAPHEKAERDYRSRLELYKQEKPYREAAKKQ